MNDGRRFLTLHDLGHMPRPQWLIEGMFDVNSLVMLAGPSKVGKSFLALDWLCSMASGRNWNGRYTEHANVLYCLGEGTTGLLGRVNAWRRHKQLSEAEDQLLQESFRVTFDVPQLYQKMSVDNMLAGLEAEQYKPSVICIDTFARSFVGMDENSQKDTGLWVEQADRLRKLGYTVLFLHHTAKNTEFGIKYRGSSAIMGAMDTSFMMTPTGKSRATLTFDKQKEHAEGKPLEFQKLQIGDGDDGSMVWIPTITIDERFTEDGIKAEEAVKELIADPTYESDAARAKVLATRLGIPENGAKMRISRLRSELRKAA